MGRPRTKLGAQEQYEDNAPPPDVANLAYLVYFALGAAVLFPWNSFITSVDYFDYLYPNTHIDRVFSVAYTIPCLIVLCVLTIFGRRISSSARVNFSLTLYLVALALVPTLGAVFIKDGDRGSTGTFCGTVVALVTTGVADGIMQGSLVGSAGELPQRYMQAFVAGSSASGVIISALRVFTKMLLPQTPRGLRASGNVYFGVTVIYLGFCIVFFNTLHRFPVINHYRMQKRRILDLGESKDETEPLSAAGDMEPVGDSLGVAESLGLNLPSHDINPSTQLAAWKNSMLLRVLKEVKWLAASLVLIYVITLSIFPGFLAEDVHSAYFGDWYPVLLLTSYNIFDFLGKELPLFFIPPQESVMIGGAVGRVLFVPLYAACLHGPQIFRTEIPVFLLTTLLGITNGYLTACFFIVAPKKVTLKDAESTGFVITIALVLGVALGSLISWVWVV